MSVRELHAAAASGNLAQLQAAIKQVLACDEQGRTALHVAAAAGQDTALYLLEAAGARLEAGAGQPVGTPLETAAAAGQAAALRTLLILGAQPSTTALQRAAEGGHLACLQALLRTGRLDVNATDGSGTGRTALDLAAAGGHASCVQALRAAGARKPWVAPALPTPPKSPKKARGRAARRRKAAAAAAVAAAPSPAAGTDEGAARQLAAPAPTTDEGEPAPCQAAASPPDLALPSGSGSSGSGSSSSSLHSMPQAQPGGARPGSSMGHLGGACGASDCQLGSDVAADPSGAPQSSGPMPAPDTSSPAWTLCTAMVDTFLAAPLRCLGSLLTAALGQLTAPGTAALGLALRGGRRAEAARRELRDSIAEALAQHIKVEFQARTRQEYHALLRSMRKDPWAFQAAAVQPAYTAAGAFTWCLFYVLPPLLLWAVWGGGAPT